MFENVLERYEKANPQYFLKLKKNQPVRGTHATHKIAYTRARTHKQTSKTYFGKIAVPHYDPLEH